MNPEMNLVAMNDSDELDPGEIESPESAGELEDPYGPDSEPITIRMPAAPLFEPEDGLE